MKISILLLLKLTPRQDMFDINQEDQKTDKNARQAKELSIRFEALEKKFSKLFEEYQITDEEFHHFMQNKENFDENTWNELEKIRQTLDKKLKLELDNIKNPLKTKSTYQNLRIDKHWLFVR
jgi:hypothetical protein